MQRINSVFGDITLVGYILPERNDRQKKEAEDSEIEDEEEENQPEFLDMKEMSTVMSGGLMFQSSISPRNEVNFLRENGETHRVEGRFALCDPWWKITCRARIYKHKLVLRSYPRYELRHNLGGDGRSLVSLFLKACGVAPDFVTQFMEWLPVERHIDLTDLLDTLDEFEAAREEHAAVAVQLKSLISASVAGIHVQVASLYPNVMTYLPTLLPGQFQRIIGRESSGLSEATVTAQAPAQRQEDPELLYKLEELIKTDVWKLGFNHIMLKEFRMIRTEAKLNAFEDCGLFQKIPDLQRNALLIYKNLKEYCGGTGSTYIELEGLVKRGKLEEPDVWNAVDFLRKQGVIVLEKRRIALRNLDTYERGIASCLRTLLEGEPWNICLDVREVLRSAQEQRMMAKACKETTDIKDDSSQNDLGPPLHSGTQFDQDHNPVELDPDQVCAAKMMCANPLTVISGKGGCGKTTVVSVVFKAAMQQQSHNREEIHSAYCDDENDEATKKAPVEVLLTAPTGRAAALLTKRTSFTAYTMHQVLWNFMCAKKSADWKPDDWKFSSVRVLVVDEGSLVCVQILHSILTILTQYAQLKKFIILGDVRQLPSIEPGNTLQDLYSGLSTIHWATEMRTNHRAESELIVQNAGLISEMGMKRFHPLNFDAFVDLNDPEGIMPTADKSFILVTLPHHYEDYDLQRAIETLLKTAPGLKDDRTSQFVAFRRKECALINEICCKHYSGHTTKTWKNALHFQPGDKVCCTKNGYVTDKTKESKLDYTAAFEQREDKGAFDVMGQDTKEQKERLCNGEIFFIKEDVTEVGVTRGKRRYLTLDDGSGREVTALFRELKRECRLQHAWARTIHTFQGSEAETIVYVLGGGRAQTWRHIYTAVTRGQKRVYVVANKDGLKEAIERKAVPRKTRLSAYVSQLLPKPYLKEEDLFSQPTCNQSFTGTPPKPTSACQARPTPEPHMSPKTTSQARRGLWTEEIGQDVRTAEASVLNSHTNPGSPVYNADDPNAGQNVRG
ncbi:DNA helicase B [Chanos chanos]|uniref:DNA helicase B n=1 Tax=Chanos chanos TaxID=29144 RepID=A0A6J2UXN6_CHACN|nr:DNA helicase B [Chanos chanos]